MVPMKRAHRSTLLPRALTCAALLLFSVSSSSCAGTSDQHADCPKVEAPPGNHLKSVATSAPEEEEPTAAAQKPRPACAGFMEVKRGNTTKVLTSSCSAWRPLEGPYGEVLDPNGNTRVVIEACDEGTFVGVLGSAKVLPGAATAVRVR